MKLRWKKEKPERALAAVGAGPRGYELHDGTHTYATVSPIGGGWRGPVTGWYWVAGHGDTVPTNNTCNVPSTTAEQAKEQASAYVNHHISNADVHVFERKRK